VIDALPTTPPGPNERDLSPARRQTGARQKLAMYRKMQPSPAPRAGLIPVDRAAGIDRVFAGGRPPEDAAGGFRASKTSHRLPD